MKITLEFDNAEKFFTELPKFAALVNLSGQFAEFKHVERSGLVPVLEEPKIPEARKEEDGTSIAGTQGQLDAMQPARKIAAQTEEMLEGRKKKAATKKTMENVAQAVEDVMPEPEEEAEEVEEEVKEVKEAPKKVKIEDIRKALNSIITAGHKAEAKQILSDFNAAKITQVAEKDYPAVLAKIKEVAAKEDAANG